MDKIYNNIVDITHNYYKYLMNMENVNGIGLGFKEINGVTTLEPCIHVLVEEKINTKYLTSNNIIPKTYMGLKTDVIKAKKPKIRSDEFIPYKKRPLESGIGVSPDSKTPFFSNGTIGCIVTKLSHDNIKEYYILSNAHVLAGLNEYPIGTPIIQPSHRSNGSFEHDVIAHLSTFKAFNFVPEPKKNEEYLDSEKNYIDAAIAKIVPNVKPSTILYDLGNFKGITKPTLSLGIQKVGFVSGLSFGSIKTLSLSITIPYDDNLFAYFEDLILSDDLENEDGDSGASVVTDDNKVVGHFMAGIDSYAYFSDIQKVLDTFKVDLYTK